jgi:hypothetical protein
MAEEAGRRSSLKNRMTAGEVSPLIACRTDLTRYQTGLKTLQNFEVLAQGGVISRSGTKFVAETKDSSKDSRLVEFSFNTTETYVIEFGHLYMRFYYGTQQAREAATTITGITAANPAVVTSNSHGYSDGDHIYISDVVGMTQVNAATRRYTVANKTANTYELSGINSSAYTAYSSGGTAQKVYTVTTKWTESEIRELDFTQSADVLYIVHKNHTPYKLTRSAHTTWTLTPLMKDTDETGATLLFTDGPYLAENITATTITPGATSGSTTLTASAITGINGGAGFLTTDIGRIVRLHDGTNWKWWEITARTSTTVVTASLRSSTAAGGVAATIRWRMGAFSESTGFPSSVSFFQDRLVFASTRGTYDAKTDSFWGSVVSDYLNFNPGTAADSDAIDLTLNSGQVNAIQWLDPHDTLRIGTSGSTYKISSSSNSAALTPTDKSASMSTSDHCSSLKAIGINASTIFWNNSNTILNDMRYIFTENDIKSLQISKVSEHITKGGVFDWSWEQNPDNIIWACRNDGQLIGCTYQVDDEVIGWHRHVLGGTDAEVKSVCSLPTSDSVDRTWLIVSRTVGGSTVRHVEYITPRYDASAEVNNNIEAPELAIFADSAITYSGYKPTTTLTPAATTGSNIVFTAGAATFASTDVGRHIRSGTGIAVIVSYTSTTVVNANIVADFASTAAIASQSWSMSVTTVSDIWHLEGQTVKVLTDGGVHSECVVASGAITLDSQSTFITAGLRYDRILETLDVDEGTPYGSGRAAKSQVVKAAVEVYESVGFRIGRDADSSKVVSFRRTSDLLSIGSPVFTGIKEVPPLIGFRNKYSLYLEQLDPLPLTILCINLKGVINDSI